MIDGLGTRTEEGVKATDFRWDGIFYEIRLINKLPVTVSEINVVVVIYDSSGQMLDFDRVKYQGTIPAGLTTIVSLLPSSRIHPRRWEPMADHATVYSDA